jgi:5'-nucleotidase
MRQLDWQAIDTVLLDMDGTLLDLRFDNWFWQQLVPSRYAQAHGLPLERVQELLRPKFNGVMGTLPWYCIDHWSRELELDLRDLTRQSLEQVRFLPGAPGFLNRLRKSGKRIALVTNAHPDTLAIKDERVGIKAYFDVCYSSHDFGAPKEHADFWPKLQQTESFAPQRTLFVDDSLPVLHCAQRFGIAHLRAVRRPDSDQPPKLTDDFVAIDSVAELI